MRREDDNAGGGGRFGTRGVSTWVVAGRLKARARRAGTCMMGVGRVGAEALRTGRAGQRGAVGETCGVGVVGGVGEDGGEAAGDGGGSSDGRGQRSSVTLSFFAGGGGSGAVYEICESRDLPTGLVPREAIRTLYARSLASSSMIRACRYLAV